MARDSRSSSGILATRSSGDEIDFVEEYSLDDVPSTLSGRGALIGGLPVSSEGSRSKSEESPPTNSEDLESALEPPDSDYAAYVPPLLFPTFKTTSRSSPAPQKAAPTRTTATEGPVQSSRANESSVWSESEPGWEEKFKKPSVWYSLACMSILMIGAIIALSVAITGKRARSDGMSPRQQEISRVLSVILSDEAFTNAASPQARAYQWMIFEDTLWPDEEEFQVPNSLIIQRYSLAVFYYATNGPDTWKEDTWLTSSECGKLTGWNGIQCDDNGLVRVLNFIDNGLQGTVPAEIGHLTGLENIVIQKEPKLAGSLPVSLGKLSLLRQLSLPENSLTGAIPSEIGNLSYLSYINLEKNELTGTIPLRFGELEQLKTLILSENEIEGIVSFDSLANTRLEYLALSSNKLTGGIDEFIRDMRFLKFLYLDRNAFNGDLPVALGEATNLQSINFDFNQFSGRIPAALGRLKKLEFISMQSNNFIGTLPGELNSLTNLKTLNVVSSNLTGNLPNLSSLTSLNNLLLVGNNFFGPISESLTSLPSLEIVFLSSNAFSGVVPTFDSDSLKGLYLSENKLQGRIPEALCQHTQLEALFLDENQLTGSIPPCLGDLSDLKQLYLFKNQLTGVVPIELGRLRKLSGMGLENNDLEGVVPGAVCAAAPEDFWSDCGGVSPDLECPCCNVCCPSADCT